jgi:pimeloyl-ACP methyl ester carboxylesterase
MKASLLLLHGAIGASRQLQAVADKLSEHYDVHLFDFPGHGGKELPDEPFSIPFFSDAVLRYIQNNNLQPVTIFGYSMGGYVGMYLAKHYPDIISRVITLGTKFHWDEATAAKEIKMLDADTITAKVPAFAATLAEMHTDWKAVLQKTADMLRGIDTLDCKGITVTSLIMLGDRDKMVTLQETESVYRSLPNAQMAVLPGTPHPIEQVNPSLLAHLLKF